MIKQIAAYAISESQQLARHLLTTGQMASRINGVDLIVGALSTRDTYPSHGSVIDADEAVRLGLEVETFPPSSDEWKWVWFLRCLYKTDARRSGLVKIFESARFSNGVQAS